MKIIVHFRTIIYKVKQNQTFIVYLNEINTYFL